MLDMDRTQVKAAALVDLDRYPIDDLASPEGQALVARCRETFKATGVLALQGFLRPEATALLAAEARGLEGAAYHYATDHTVYFSPPDPDLPADDPRRMTVRTDKGNVPYDLIPRSAHLRAFYEWDATLAFVAAVLDQPGLERHPDPMAALNINVHGEGQELGWHFDRAEFAVTLALQQSEEGGVFQYVPGLRSETDENYPGVARVIAGAGEVRELTAPPGTLSLFRGHHSLHRVTPGAGPSKRLLAALSYVTEPTTFSAYARNLFYGREQPAMTPE
ncbi:MAG: hypothetical protein B7Y97_13180 [Sphingomonas sp. 32-66-10]|nr:MAG: hypothetical protein B7Y97_13180 [Sphingomonas sp. 32-66-10]